MSDRSTIEEKYWSLCTCCIATSYVFIALYASNSGGFAKYAGQANTMFFMIGATTVFCSIMSCYYEIKNENERVAHSWVIALIIFLLNVPIFMLLIALDYKGISRYIDFFIDAVLILDFSAVR